MLILRQDLDKMLRGMIIMSQKRYDEVVIEKEKTKTNELRK